MKRGAEATQTVVSGVKRTARIVPNPLLVSVLKLSWNDLHLDQTKQAVVSLKHGPRSTLESFIWAASRFECFLGLKRGQEGDVVFSEGLLVEFFEEFLYRLSDQNGRCLLDVGSFFPQMSLVKKYVLLRYSVNVGDCKELNSKLKAKTKGYCPQKKRVFTPEQMFEWCARANQDLGDQQKTLIAICSFFGLARSVETMNLVRENFVFVGESDGFFIDLKRCEKNPKVSRSKVPQIENCNVRSLMESHLAAIPVVSGDSRVWWKWSPKTSTFQAQHLGKKIVAEIAKEIAHFHDFNPDEFGSHSFRRSGATSLANSGGSYEQLMAAGAWNSVSVARGYIEESDFEVNRRANLIKGNSSDLSSSSKAPEIPVSSHQAFHQCHIASVVFQCPPTANVTPPADVSKDDK